MSQMLFIDR